MFIIDFFKSLFNKKETKTENIPTEKPITIDHSIEINNEPEEVVEEKKEESSVSSIEEAVESKEEVYLEDIHNTDISEPSTEDTSSDTEEEKVEESEEIPEDVIIDPIPEEMEMEEEEEKDPKFSVEEIQVIKDILRPIVKSYNYEKKSDFAHYAEFVKTIKCFLTTAKDSELLIFRPTQSDTYNNEIGLFVRKCILKEFKDGLVAAGINDLDIECTGGKIKIRKKI
jgi:hypothetical protein